MGIRASTNIEGPSHFLSLWDASCWEATCLRGQRRLVLREVGYGSSGHQGIELTCV